MAKVSWSQYQRKPPISEVINDMINDDPSIIQAAVTSWTKRMTAVYGGVFDQETGKIITFEEALVSRDKRDANFGNFGVYVWDKPDLAMALSLERAWEDNDFMTHYSTFLPASFQFREVCDWADHTWTLEIEEGRIARFVCNNPCEQPFRRYRREKVFDEDREQVVNSQTSACASPDMDDMYMFFGEINVSIKPADNSEWDDDGFFWEISAAPPHSGRACFRCRGWIIGTGARSRFGEGEAICSYCGQQEAVLSLSNTHTEKEQHG